MRRDRGLSLRQVNASLAADFRSVLDRAGEEAHRCLCTVAHVESWRDPSLAAPCRERILASGRPDGFLLYRGAEAIGWCQAGRRDELPLLAHGRDLPADPDVWAISCLVLVPEVRHRGMCHILIRYVLEELRGRGVPRVQAFACRYREDEDTTAFIEFPESVCRKAGMTLDQDHPMRPIYGLALSPPTPPA